MWTALGRLPRRMRAGAEPIVFGTSLRSPGNVLATATLAGTDTEVLGVGYDNATGHSWGMVGELLPGETYDLRIAAQMDGPGGKTAPGKPFRGDIVVYRLAS